MLGLWRDLVVSDGGAGGAECLLADLLGKLVKAVAHEPENATTARRGQEKNSVIARYVIAAPICLVAAALCFIEAPQ